MEEYEQSAVETIQEELVEHKAILAKGNAMKKLIAMPEFEELFKQDFVDNYYKTSAVNCWIFNAEQTQNFNYHIKARSIFSRYLDEVTEKGDIAEQVVIELEKALIEEQKAEIECADELEAEVILLNK